MKVYHYTSFTKIGGVLGKHRGEPAGLIPRRAVGFLFSSLDNPRAVFGLLEPTPDNWKNNHHFPLTWQTLIHDLFIAGEGAVLIEAEVDTEKHKAFVGERAHLEGLLYKDKEGIPYQFLHKDKTEAEKAFMSSLIPLDEYISKQQTGKVGYSLPEVVILNPIPVENITVSSHQPLLEYELEQSLLHHRNHLIDLITRGYAQSELSAWRTNYEKNHGPLELSKRGIERR